MAELKYASQAGSNTEVGQLYETAERGKKAFRCGKNRNSKNAAEACNRYNSAVGQIKAGQMMEVKVSALNLKNAQNLAIKSA